MSAYVTLAEAGTYFASRLHSEAWAEASVTDQQKALDMATRAIDRRPLKGTKYADDQAQAFPRYPDTTVPAAVKDATCEQALWLLSLSDYERHRQKQHVLGIVGGSVGSANEYAAEGLVKANRVGTVLCPEARELLRPWLLGAVNVT